MPGRILVDRDRFRSLNEEGKAKGCGVFRFQPTAETVATDQARTLRFTFSDGSIDRYGDTINPKGWDLADYKTNAVALWAHDASQPPIGKSHNVGVIGDKLKGDIEFATAEISPFADSIYRMYKGGFLSAVSVGFVPLDWKRSDDKSRPGGFDFLKQQLLEISAVPIPALPTALVDARAAGIDTKPLIGWAEKVLDKGGMLLVPRAELEAMRKAAGAPTQHQVKMPDPAGGKPPIKVKSLWHVAWLADILMDLNFLQDSVEWEAAYEEDGSPIPQQMLDALKALGQILLDMTAEEVAELLADTDAGDGDAAPVTMAAKRMKVLRQLAGADAKLVDAVLDGLTPPKAAGLVDLLAIKGAIAGALKKAGKVLSAKNAKALQDAHECMTKACDHVKGVIDANGDDDPADDGGGTEDPEVDPLDLTTAAADRARRERRARALKASASAAAIAAGSQ